MNTRFFPAFLAVVCMFAPSLFAQICSLNADGTGLKPLATVAGSVRSLSYSPDGAYIAFSAVTAGRVVVFLMTSDGKNVHRIYQGNGSTSVGWPVFTPDGKRLLVSTRLESDSAVSLYFMNLDGGGLQPFKSNASDARYSADGSQILFDRSTSPFETTIYVANSDGSEEKQIPTGFRISTHASFNPKNSSQITFTSMDAVPTIWVQNTDGTNKHAISQPPLQADAASYYPDGANVLYSGTQPGSLKFEVFRNSADGTSNRQLAVVPLMPAPGISVPFIMLYPVSSPSGKKIACLCTPPLP